MTGSALSGVKVVIGYDGTPVVAIVATQETYVTLLYRSRAAAVLLRALRLGGGGAGGAGVAAQGRQQPRRRQGAPPPLVAVSTLTSCM